MAYTDAGERGPPRGRGREGAGGGEVGQEVEQVAGGGDQAEEGGDGRQGYACDLKYVLSLMIIYLLMPN